MFIYIHICIHWELAEEKLNLHKTLHSRQKQHLSFHSNLQCPQFTKPSARPLIRLPAK